MIKKQILPEISVLSKKHREENRLCLHFEYHLELIKLIKKLPDARWSKQMSCWHIPHTKENLALLRNELSKNASLNFNQLNDSTPIKLKLKNKEKEVLNNFYKYLKGKRYSESTLKTYVYLVSEFMIYHQKESIANKREIELYIEHDFIIKNPAISTHRQFVSAIRHYLDFCGADFVLEFNSIAPKKDKKLPNVLSKEEILRLIQVTKNLKHRTCITLLYSSGLRIGELLKLQLKDLDFDRKLLRIEMGKGRKDRYVPIANSILPMMQNYLTTYTPKKYFIENDTTHTPYAATSVRSFLKISLKLAGIKKLVSPHTLRHSYATHLLESGTDIRYIQTLLGHSKPETTMVYTHVRSDAIRAINNPLDLIVQQFQNSQKKHIFITDKND